MSTAAERKRRQRQKEREANFCYETIRLTHEERMKLDELYLVSGNGRTWLEWAKDVLITGAMFAANSGGLLPAGKKARRDTVTTEGKA